MKIQKKFSKLGQTMIEYILIVALVAVASITIWKFFGDTIKEKITNIAEIIFNAGKDNSQPTSGSSSPQDNNRNNTSGDGGNRRSGGRFGK